jgi:hypothetical protein
MARSENVAAIEAAVGGVTEFINDLGIIPRQGVILDRVSLGFVSKSVSDSGHE